LNAEGAKVSQSAQKEEKEYKKEYQKEEVKRTVLNQPRQKLGIDSCFFLVFFCISFLRPLRNLRALCVQKLTPTPTPT
jgi:hypothetical protein